ncbi:hypothetical protein LCGC14_0903840 [marine sediment metagenome]|uniref:Disease resistance R13L4/SHOC-2-like LRR domain-containing protein n=1 Tax=marine sediment metagenome TaxID=412755 RepID=A0A0F9P0A4_9ZZZZ|nr:hypothetical protein [archaeon]HEC38418.1 hypothetical protein [bacterium]
MDKKEFIINDYLSLKLEDGKTVIYVSGKQFRQCKFLLLDIPITDDGVKEFSLDDIDSIDEAAEKLNKSLEPRKNKAYTYTIPPEVEFWGHSSNLQVWYENGYNTRLLHYNLAFSLLQKLALAGDSQAKKVFKEEVIDRYNSGINSVREYLRSHEYLRNLTVEEFLSLIEDKNEIAIIEQLRASYPRIERRKTGGTVAIILRENLEIKKGRVVKLNLRGLELKQIPEYVRGLHHLEHLDASHNLLEELPEWINGFQSLKKLEIGNNHLKTLPEEIGALQSLEWMQAHDNELITLPESIGEIKSLKTLELYQNKLEVLPDSICNLFNLEKLDLRENNLKNLPKSIGELKNLKSLILEENQIKTLPETIIELKDLETLILANNKLFSLPILIGRLTVLKLVAISFNPLWKLPDSFYRLPILRKLFIEGTNLREDQLYIENFSSKVIDIYPYYSSKKEKEF